jgi:hypothetical protein
LTEDGKKSDEIARGAPGVGGISFRPLGSAELNNTTSATTYKREPFGPRAMAPSTPTVTTVMLNTWVGPNIRTVLESGLVNDTVGFDSAYYNIRICLSSGLTIAVAMMCELSTNITQTSSLPSHN